MFGAGKNNHRETDFGISSSSTGSSSDNQICDTTTGTRSEEDETSEEGIAFEDDDESFEATDDEGDDEETLSEGGENGQVIIETDKVPRSSMDSRDRSSEAPFSHSFASEATEERAHVSSPRASSRSPQKKCLVVSTQSENQNDYQVNDVPMTPPSNTSGVLGTGSPTSPTAISPSSIPSVTSGSTRSSRRSMVNRNRVPGGAAAKLIGRRNEDDFPVMDDGDDSLEVVPPVEELMKSRDMAKAEFSVGSPRNRRYRSTPEEVEEARTTPLPSSEAGLPSILNRNEVFHENAAAAIVSLLSPSGYNPSCGDNLIQALSTQSGDLHAKGKKTKEQAPNPFHPPRKSDEVPPVSSAKSDTSSGVGAPIESQPSASIDSRLVQKFFNKKLDRRLEVIKSRMKDPNKNLTELITAIAPPRDGVVNRHYMVRRKNACGTLQVLTANVSHRVNICWTVGVLSALVTVLEDSGPGTLDDAILDLATRREFIEARKRAVATLVNLATPQDNKIPMFHCPKLIASVIRVINQDDGEAKRGCCDLLALLSKSKDNKTLMAQIPGLVDAVTGVIDPKERVSDSKDSDDQSTCSHGSNRDAVDKVLSPEEEEKKEDIEANPSEDPAEASARYDEDPNEFLHGSRQNVFALLGNLVKEKDIAFDLARHSYLVDTLVAITRLQESCSQEYALKILAHLSRNRSNSKIMVFKKKNIVPAVVFATYSQNDESRKYACFALQNLSQDKPCRQEMASTDNLLTAVCRRIRNSKDEEEKLAALHTLKNLTDEPANLIPMTNTPECFATLMQVAHASDESVTEMMQYIACDALATLSHWFRSIATSGQRIGTAKRNDERAKDELFVPTLRVITWEQWQ